MRAAGRLLTWTSLLTAAAGLSVQEALLRFFLNIPTKELRDFPGCGTVGRASKAQVNRIQHGAGQHRNREKDVRNEERNHYDYDYYDYYYNYDYDYIPGNQGCSADYGYQCSYGEGHCSSNYECSSPYVCGSQNCRQEFSPYANNFTNCCTISQNQPETGNETPGSSAGSDLITSINYPKNYTTNEETKWTVVSTSGHLLMTVHDMKLEASIGTATGTGTGCVYDWLKIEFGSIVKPLLCGEPRVPFQYTFTGNETLTITFRSDYSVTNYGFKISFSCESPTDGDGTCAVTGPEVTAIGDNSGSESAPVSGPVIEEEELTSPNYPQNYDNDLEEVKNLTADSGERIQIGFIDFQLEGGPGCPYDYVTITEEFQGATETVLEKTCGPRQQNTTFCKIYSKTEEVTVTFKSDDIVTDRGFKLKWAKISSEDVPTEDVPDGCTNIANSETCTGLDTDFDCCTNQAPCGYGQGDCDTDSECAGNLR